jgi:hypothetical protein
MATISKSRSIDTFLAGNREVKATGVVDCGWTIERADGWDKVYVANAHHIDMIDSSTGAIWRIDLSPDEALRIAARLARSLGKRIVDPD